jgi:RNA polymerase sigma-70 factor (ECF subfamily)
MIVETDDKALMGLFQNKATRNEGFKVILTQYSQLIYFFLRRMGLDHEDADELLQDIFVKFSGTAVLNDTIKITLYRSAATDCLAYRVKHHVTQLQGMTSEQLLIMVLKVQEEFDFADIAQITSIPVSEVRSLFKTGINKMNNQSNIKN